MSERPTLLAVHAHPDDETISTGGVLARASAEGKHVVLVCATHGEVGEIVLPELDTPEIRATLGEVREAELREACRILGVHELFFLDYRDSGMVGTPDNDNPASFHRADLDEATGRLVRIVRETRAQVMVTYNERGGYGHPDHIAAHNVTLAAFDAAGDPSRYPEQGLEPWQPQKLYFTVFSLSSAVRFHELIMQYGDPESFGGEDFDPSSVSVPDEAVTTRVDVSPFAAAKRAAILVHRTQISPAHPFLQIPEDKFPELLGIETFSRVRSFVPVDDPESDLFAGI
jgi:mycothiol conjugate amidase Mca